MKTDGGIYLTSTGYHVQVNEVKDTFCICFELDDNLQMIEETGVSGKRFKKVIVSHDKLIKEL